MCGIGSITLDKTVGPSIASRIDAAADALLKALDHRGGDACGILGVSATGELHTEKAPCRAEDFILGRSDLPAGTRAVAIHTRMATQGEAWWNRNNHPVAAGFAHVMHNGVVWEHFGTKRAQGEPEVDTYALAVSAYNATKSAAGTPIERAAHIVLQMAENDGSAAVHVAFEGFPGLITARIAQSPLYVTEAHGVRITASTIDAIKQAAKALGLKLAQVTRTYTPKPTKKQKRRGITLQPVAYSTDAIEQAPEGTVLVWNAGRHEQTKVTIPYRYGAGHYISGSAWSDEDEAWYQDEMRGHGFTGSGNPDYAAIAARLLEASAMRCELCDDDATKLTPAYGLLACDDCIRAMDTDPQSIDENRPAAPVTTYYQQKED